MKGDKILHQFIIINPKRNIFPDQRRKAQSWDLQLQTFKKVQCENNFEGLFYILRNLEVESSVHISGNLWHLLDTHIWNEVELETFLMRIKHFFFCGGVWNIKRTASH